MIIEEVSFLNFSRIYSGLGKTYLHINLSRLKNKIYLFIGENGSGKTSIMRSLHPFAYNSGSGDETANADFIIEGKDGKKEIVISHNDHKYDIVHIYSRKKDGRIELKSFIKEDGAELNSSGTVKTFKEIILSKLGLDETFLSLLSLGNTVDGFVKYTSANRKKFAVQIFSQLSIYAKYYRTVSIKVRDTKSVLSNITSKLERYKSYDIDDLELHKIELEKKLIGLKTDLNTIAVNIGGALQIIKDNEEFIQDYDQKRSKFDEVLREIDVTRGKISTKKDLVVLENHLGEITKTVNDLRITISGIESSIKAELDLMESKNSSVDSMKETLSRMSKNIDLQELTELKSSLEKELSEILSKKLPKRPSWSKEDLVKINIYLDELLGMCVDLVNEVTDISVIPIVLKDYLANNNVDTKISRSLEELTYAYNQENVLRLSKDLLDEVRIRKISSKCKTQENCPYMKFYQTVMSVIDTDVEGIDQRLQAQLEDIHRTEDMLRAASIIKRLYKFISLNETYFKLPTELFDNESFIIKYLESQSIYDASYLSYIIEIEETYERKDMLEQKIADASEKLVTLEHTTEVYNQMSKEIEQLESSICDINSVIEKQRNDLDYNTAQLKEFENLSEEIQSQIKLLRILQCLRSEFNSIKSELSVMESKMSGIEQSRQQYNEYELKKSSTESSIRETEQQLRNTQLTIEAIKNLKSEQRELMEKYSKDKLILEAISPTKGIPIDFINYYIKGTLIDRVNELLDMVYHERLRLIKSKTTIDEEEFTIPYLKRNTTVSDISRASDGEKAIISLAFSLALLHITAGPYNILLLDEMDTTLDMESRAKYIELLEQFTKTIKSEQLFLISHNSMFDVYPVNILMTSKCVVNTRDKSSIVDLTA